MIALILLSLLGSTAAAPWWRHVLEQHFQPPSRPQPVWTPTRNIPQLAEKLGATTLVDLVTKAGLAGALSGPGPFTVFGPVNDAFTSIPASIAENITAVKSILLYHVISGEVYSRQLTNDLQAQSLLAGEKIRVNIYQKEPPVVTAEGAKVFLVDQQATNGVIHVIKKVMIPPIGTIPQYLTSAFGANYSTLVTAVEAAGLVSVLAGEGPFTLFAPTNKAFAKIPAATLNALLKNKTQLTKVLTYHLVSSTQWSAGLSNGQVVKTVEGSTVTVHVSSSGVSLSFGSSGQSQVVNADISATNGVIHAIDTVLLPSDL